ncbi:uncharacterized protein [Montipora foliosa]|uniref:uncharacterized protein isoform X1 n=1 Tax=Montipora foliosa TaxID=591990 RepID=UPI0035F1E4E8
MKRNLCFAIIALLIIASLCTLLRNNKELPSLLSNSIKGSFGSQHTGNQDQTKSRHKIYDRVQELLIFVGYPRSGHTLVSSLLDAHPHVIVANEFDILAQWQKWDTTTKNKYYLFDQLLMNSKKEADVGYRSATVQHRYSYHVPGQWQGTYRDSIMVMGDKKGGKTTRQLFHKENQEALKQIQQVLKIPLKFVHVIRNPYDNIATMLLRAVNKRNEADTGEKINQSRRLDEQINKYFTLVKLNNKLKTRFGDSVHHLHSSQLIMEPRKTLLGVCEFLQLRCDQQYLADCSSIVFKEGTKTRQYVVWTDQQKKLVREKLQSFPSLKDYNFDN